LKSNEIIYIGEDLPEFVTTTESPTTTTTTRITTTVQPSERGFDYERVILDVFYVVCLPIMYVYIMNLNIKIYKIKIYF